VSTWGLNNEFSKKIALLILAINQAGIHFTITSGYRSADQQKELIRQYQAGNKNIYTPLPVGKSLHGNTTWYGSPDSLAMDISTGNPSYAGRLSKSLGIVWGGLSDPVHFGARGGTL